MLTVIQIQCAFRTYAMLSEWPASKVYKLASFVLKSAKVPLARRSLTKGRAYTCFLE